MNQPMMNKSRGESAYLIFLFGSSQFSGNSARAKPKNEYDSVFACCCCWFDEFCVFVAFVLRVRVRVRSSSSSTTTATTTNARSSSKSRSKQHFKKQVCCCCCCCCCCVKKKRERNETWRATDEQQVVKRSARERLEAFTTKKSGNLGRRKTTNTHNKTPSSIVYTFLLSLSLSLSLSPL